MRCLRHLLGLSNALRYFFARREAYRLQLLGEKQAELKKFKESLKKENGGA